MAKFEDPSFIVEGIRLAIRAEIDRIIAEEVDDTIARVNKRVAASADTLALSILKRYEISPGHNEVVIRVRKD